MVDKRVSLYSNYALAQTARRIIHRSERPRKPRLLHSGHKPIAVAARRFRPDLEM